MVMVLHRFTFRLTQNIFDAWNFLTNQKWNRNLPWIVPKRFPALFFEILFDTIRIVSWRELCICSWFLKAFKPEGHSTSHWASATCLSYSICSIDIYISFEICWTHSFFSSKTSAVIRLARSGHNEWSDLWSFRSPLLPSLSQYRGRPSDCPERDGQLQR